jgi:hypothetical protein
MAKWENIRPHLRQVYANFDPRTADQSTIFTLKSCVFHWSFVASVIIRHPEDATSGGIRCHPWLRVSPVLQLRSIWPEVQLVRLAIVQQV